MWAFSYTNVAIVAIVHITIVATTIMQPTTLPLHVDCKPDLSFCSYIKVNVSSSSQVFYKFCLSWSVVAS